MTTLSLPNHVDALTNLQLRVARRADQLRASSGRGPRSDRQLWLRAEFEILELVERTSPAVLFGAADEPLAAYCDEPANSPLAVNAV